MRRSNKGDVRQRGDVRLRVGAVGGALVLAGAAAVGVAYAATGTTIHGCVNNTTRVLSVSDTCAKQETALTWNQQGAPGPSGPAGPSGAPGPSGPPGPAAASTVNTYEQILHGSDIDSTGFEVEAFMTCPNPDQVPISGGYRIYISGWTAFSSTLEFGGYHFLAAMPFNQLPPDPTSQLAKVEVTCIS